jgi:hypothetical protein
MDEGKIKVKPLLPSDCIGTPYSGELQSQRKMKLKEEMKDKFSKESLEDFFYYDPNKIQLAMKIKIIKILKEYY